MVDSHPFERSPETARLRNRGPSIETGTIAGILAASGTTGYVRTWLKAALGRDPLLAYQEAATLAGMLELLTCQEARAWLLPALSAALRQDPDAAFAASLEIAQALKPAAMVVQSLERRVPEPANTDGAPAGIARGIEE